VRSYLEGASALTVHLAAYSEGQPGLALLFSAVMSRCLSASHPDHAAIGSNSRHATLPVPAGNDALSDSHETSCHKLSQPWQQQETTVRDTSSAASEIESLVVIAIYPFTY
jgi:hypothetical protein